MSRTTYRLFDGTTRVSTAVKLKDGSILMVYPRMENFADVDLWKWVIEHEAEYVDSSLTLSTHNTKLTINVPAAPPTMIPLIPQLSPYTPPLAPIKIDPFMLGPTVEGIHDDITLTPRISPRAEFQEPLPSTPPPVKSVWPPAWEEAIKKHALSTSLAHSASLAPSASVAPSTLAPSASVAPYDPTKLGPTAEGPGYDSDDEVHRDWLMKRQLEDLQSDLARLSQTMNTQINLMDVRIKALIKKLD
jgi:hypothetical protein